MSSNPEKNCLKKQLVVDVFVTQLYIQIGRYLVKIFTDKLGNHSIGIC